MAKVKEADIVTGDGIDDANTATNHSDIMKKAYEFVEK